MKKIRSLFAVLLGVVAFHSAAFATIYAIDAHLISAGAPPRSSSNCFTLDAMIGEPVVGFSSGGTYGLSGGFLAAASVSSDVIFANHFEDCSP